MLQSLAMSHYIISAHFYINNLFHSNVQRFPIPQLSMFAALAPLPNLGPSAALLNNKHATYQYEELLTLPNEMKPLVDLHAPLTALPNLKPSAALQIAQQSPTEALHPNLTKIYCLKIFI